MKLISNISEINLTDQVLFNKLCIIENYKKIMPDNVSKFEIIDKESFIFSIKGMPAIKLRISEKNIPSKIILKSLDSKIDFSLTGFISQSNNKLASFHLEFDGNLNPMLQMMVKNPLQSFINDLSENIKNLN
ncbi:MAG: orotate phosphoribosyltransferase [Flavobacteriaceae bacterium]|nr:orotate phosphoribosyltransferase [Flavobacteriaceae bacterium]|tara:strand:+ start:3668 stop:4063 length:396 start_codon:yes stop_codon:yes gene_type:complete